jgi:periplasmic divalent cation tolerance protein
MGDTGGEHGEGVEALAFELLFGALAGLGDVTDEHDEAHGGVGVVDGGDVEVEVAIFGVKDLEVTTDDGARLAEFIPIEITDALSELLADDLLFLEAEELAGGAVDVGDLASLIEHDDAFLKGVENFFEEAFFTQQLKHDALDLAGVEAIHAFDELVDEGGSHKVCGMSMYIIFCTFPDVETARKTGTALVTAQLAACVNLLPAVESIYRWEGRVKTAAEVLAVFKTSVAVWPVFEQRLRELHPYEVPEIVAVRPEQVSKSYERWVGEETCA